MTSNVNYTATYFKYPVPSPINGEPTNKTLKRLQKELRANSSSVETDLGGGDHGYLGLILADLEYMKIVPRPDRFDAPTWPGELVIDASATPVEAVHEKEKHRELMRVYRECKNVEKALLRHIQSAVEEKYIEHLLDEHTGLIEHDIPTVMEYLFANYGKVPSEEVKQRESEVLTLSFNPADPMITLYRPIEQLQKLATDAGIPYSSAQILEFGLTSIRSTRDFEKGLSDWNKKDIADKTWNNFKTHFKEAQTELKDIRGPTMQQAGYHHANMLAAQLRTTIDGQGAEMLAMLQDIAVSPATDHPQPEVDPQNPVANAVVQQDIQLQMLTILQAMQANNSNNSGRGRFGRGGRNGNQGRAGRGSRNRRTPDNATFPRAIVNEYCHTHGGCNHGSADCTRPAPGHKNEATMNNRLDGSNAFCEPINE